MNEQCIQVKNLTKSFSGRKVINGLSFEVNKGEVFGKVGVQLQHTEYQNMMTVEEECIEYASLYEKPSDYKALLHSFGLSDLKKSYINKLSGGKKQKLSVVLALIGNPEIVFLDELTTGLDVAARREVWRTLKHLKKSELLSKIAELTKQVAVLDGYLAKKKSCLLSPVLIKEVPECKVAYRRTRLDSYDDLFDKMPQMGELMEQAGCICALPEYCFTNYLEPSYKEEDILVELCESVTECKDDIGELHFKSMPKIQAASIFHKGSYNTLATSYERVLKYVEDQGYAIVGAIWESYIDGVWNKENESDWLTEIQVPIRKIASKEASFGIHLCRDVMNAT